MSSVDVIVPCYRYAQFLRQCVESALDQADVQVRVLILDDASPDNTPEVGAELAREDSRVTYRRHDVNKGHIATYNEGIEWASADYMLLLSADDYLLPGALQRAAEVLDAHPEVGLAFGRAAGLQDGETKFEMGSLGGRSYSNGMRILTGQEFIDVSGATCIVPTATAVVRTAVQKRVGGYRADLPHAGDMEMWLRFAANGSVCALDSLQAVYRMHGQNMSHAYSSLRDFRQRELVVEYFVKDWGHLLRDVDAVQRNMNQALSYAAVGNASSAFNEGETELSEQFAEIAVHLFPGIKRTLPWLKLTCKQRVGQKGWQALQPTMGRMRRLASSLTR
jgi:glycosyltransferase involved in cell wall biosynthesis